jgi:hypothetical protein
MIRVMGIRTQSLVWSAVVIWRQASQIEMVEVEIRTYPDRRVEVERLPDSSATGVLHPLKSRLAHSCTTDML